jgi:hypothetical protein
MQVKLRAIWGHAQGCATRTRPRTTTTKTVGTAAAQNWWDGEWQKHTTVNVLCFNVLNLFSGADTQRVCLLQGLEGCIDNFSYCTLPRHGEVKVRYVAFMLQGGLTARRVALASALSRSRCARPLHGRSAKILCRFVVVRSAIMHWLVQRSVHHQSLLS